MLTGTTLDLLTSRITGFVQNVLVGIVLPGFVVLAEVYPVVGDRSQCSSCLRRCAPASRSRRADRRDADR